MNRFLILLFAGFLLGSSCKSEKQGASIDLDKLRFYEPTLFRYLPYKFTFVNLDSAYVVSAQNASIIENGGFFDLRVSDSSHIAEICFRSQQGNKVFRKRINVKDLPITIRLHGKTTGDIIQIDNLERNNLIAEIINYNINIKFPVVSFRISYFSSKEPQIFQSIGNSFPIEFIESFKLNGVSNAPVIIDKIIIETESGGRKYLKPVFYYVSNTN